MIFRGVFDQNRQVQKEVKGIHDELAVVKAQVHLSGLDTCLLLTNGSIMKYPKLD